VLARSQAITRENLAILDNWIKNEPLVDWVKPRAGTTAMLKLDIPMSSREFCIDLLEKTGVMLTPGDAFDMEGYARIGYANDREILEAGLKELSRYLGEIR
jgi:aspartate/methionine/tyrosine aminotransferase